MSARNYLEQLTGQRIPGGCDECDAFQTVDTSNAPIYRIAVHHDEWCPVYAAMTKRTT